MDCFQKTPHTQTTTTSINFQYSQVFITFNFAYMYHRLFLQLEISFLSVMSSEFRRSRQKLSAPAYQYSLNKQNINLNAPPPTNQFLELNKAHNQQIRRKQKEWKCKFEERQIKFNQQLALTIKQYESKLREKEDYINILQEMTKNIQISSQLQIEDLNKKIADKQNQKQQKMKFSTKTGRQSVSNASELSYRLSVQRGCSRSILRCRQNIESKHKVVPARKPVYTRQMFLQRKNQFNY